MRNRTLHNTDKGDDMFGEEDRHVAAQAALPILIELAKATKKIPYGELGIELEIPHHSEDRIMSKMLGCIVTTLARLGKEWNEELPYLTALVVSTDTGYPNYPSDTPNEEFDAEFERIYKYQHWDAVQHKLLSEPESDVQKSIAEELRGIREELQGIKKVLINLGDRFDRP